MVNVNANYHTDIQSESPKTRIRIYFIGDDVDCTDDNDVVTNGTLLKWSNTDTDSSRRISAAGVTFTEYYTKDADWTIGGCTSNTVSMSLLNDDGALDSISYGRCKVYLDCQNGSTWNACPMGVYILDEPRKMHLTEVAVTGYDMMSTLDAYADDWWQTLDFSGGLTLNAILSSMATQLGFRLKPGMTVLNGTHSYDQAPLQADKTTYRSILSMLAGAAGANARFDRNGYLELKWFGAVSTVYSTIFTANISSYAVLPVDTLEVRGSETDFATAIGNGANPYLITDNKFYCAESEAALTAFATPVYTRITALPAFRPSAISVQADPSVEAGDIVVFSFKGNTYTLPLFQQTLIWSGQKVYADLYSSGNMLRPVVRESPSVSQDQYKDRKSIHNLSNTVEELRSTIQNADGDISELWQTANSIIQTVSNVNASVQSILDPTGEMWTFMHNLSDTVDQNNDSAETKFDNISNYIRFINGSIVLGSSDNDATKLKIMSNAMMFYIGPDEETDITKAVAYFTFNEFYETIIKSANLLQIGTSGNTNYQFVKRENGHLTLWRV